MNTAFQLSEDCSRFVSFETIPPDVEPMELCKYPFSSATQKQFLKAHIVPRDSFLEEIKPGQNVNCMIETGFIFWGMVFFITLAGLMVEWGELAAKGPKTGLHKRNPFQNSKKGNSPK